MEIRRARPSDFTSILELAETCYEQNLQPAQRQQGFLSARLTSEQVAGMAEEPGIIVACDSGQIAGFMCASRCDSTYHPPVVKRMIAAFNRALFLGQPLAAQKVFIYGPVCIAPAYRGHGVLRALFRNLKKEASGLYDAGAGFVAQGNLHSLQAHIEGLGMQAVGRFAHAGRSYQILAFKISE